MTQILTCSGIGSTSFLQQPYEAQSWEWPLMLCQIFFIRIYLCTTETPYQHPLLLDEVLWYCGSGLNLEELFTVVFC